MRIIILGALLLFSACAEHAHTYAYETPRYSMGSKEAEYVWLDQAEEEIEALIQRICYAKGTLDNQRVRFTNDHPTGNQWVLWMKAKGYKAALKSLRIGDTTDNSLMNDRGAVVPLVREFFEDPDARIVLLEGFRRVRTCKH